jgi:isopentenyl-diphosphate delta-isomerase
MRNIIARNLLHRGFGTFLFSPRHGNRLLLQQRASSKLAFPNVWSNTCCSHPLDLPAERGTEGDFDSEVLGARRAAMRKLKQELGVQVPLDAIQFVTRMYYKAETEGMWGEHESKLYIPPGMPYRDAYSIVLVGYALIIQSDVELDINTNEVQDLQYVSRELLEEMLDNPKLEFSPWFRLICRSTLLEWWKRIDEGSLDEILGDTTIHRMM